MAVAMEATWVVMPSSRVSRPFGLASVDISMSVSERTDCTEGVRQSRRTAAASRAVVSA